MNINTPTAIVIGFAMLSLAVFFQGSILPGLKIDNNSMNADKVVAADDKVKIDASIVRRESNNRIYGNPDAEIKIVEFSDVECPFCARVHPTIKRIVDESEGKINWEYRHFPLPGHANAVSGALASECVAKFAGNDAFWKFLDKLFATTGHSTEFYKNTAISLGVSESDFVTCVNDEATQAIVQDDLETVQELGATGTPYNLIIHPDGRVEEVKGALPYNNWLPLIK